MIKRNDCPNSSIESLIGPHLRSSHSRRPITTTTASPFGSTTPSSIPIAMSLNLNAEPAAPLAPQRKKNLNLGDKDDMMEQMMVKATKVQLKTDLEAEELPQPIATQEPAEAAATGTTQAEEMEHDSTAQTEEEEPELEHAEPTVADEVAETEVVADETEEEEPTAATEVEVTTSIEQRLNQITKEVGKIAAEAAQPAAEVGRQSFMSLTDLIRNLRPNDKANTAQIDSDYSNTMRLGEPGAVIVESSRKVRNSQQVY